MEFKNETPSKTNLRNKVLTNQMSCDSPFRLLPNVSTPPSRFAKILNPFEPHLIESLHLSTFSPSVFAQVSTPKTQEKFKWTIDDISGLRPADIDEATVSQHVSNHDPTVESLVQEKIDQFFNEKAIVPSPLNEQVKRIPLLTSPPPKPPSQSVFAQTLLSLPPILPKHLEDALAPYFTDLNEPDDNSLLYRKLFEEDHHSTPESSPALSTGMSPIQFSPEFSSPKGSLENNIEIPELRDCTLSPIGRTSQPRSACRLSFSGHMSVDASVTVPNKTLNLYGEDNQLPTQVEESGNDSSGQWDMEYKHVSILSKSPLSSPELINSSNSNTPHSKIFTSQRKRLSDSFKDEEFGDVEMDEVRRSKSRFKSNLTDVGYFTRLGDSPTAMFASTPTKF